MNSDFKPNVSFPLATSYDTRNTYPVPSTSGVDQRALNFVGVPIQNSLTGAAKYELAKRTGASISGSLNAAAGFVPYVCSDAPIMIFAGLSSAGTPNNIVTDFTNSQTLIASPTNYRPCFIDQAKLTTTSYCVVQCVELSTNPHQVFFGVGTAAPWTSINTASANFNALIHVGKMEFIDGYSFIMATDGRVYNSAINTFTTWNTGTDFLAKQIEQDTPMGLARLGRQLLVFGSESCEVMYNAGNPTGSPMATAPTLAQKVGLGGRVVQRLNRHYYVVVGSILYFIGTANASKNFMALYAYGGGAMEMVSTPAINGILISDGASLCVGSCILNGQNFVSIVLTLPGEATMNRWLLFNPRTKEWFEGNSTAFSPFGPFYHLGSAIAGGNRERNAYFLGASGGCQDDGVDYECKIQFKLPVGNSSKRHQHKWLAVEGDTPRAAASLTVEVSDDDYQTWTNLGSIDMTQPSKKLTRLGGFYDRAVALSYTGSQSIRLTRFLSRID